ncbi:MAG: AraC family transcriptional regulator [Mediterranea sp.]|jgi:AraC-like DNA-binding protein|nr:AraC family transcriptional regulator [Mediterranea sp.]
MNKENHPEGGPFKYLIVNETDRRFGLWVNTVGCQSVPPHSPYPPQGHPAGYFFVASNGRVLHEYQLVYITQGQGVFASDSTPETSIGQGRLIVLFPGQWHSYQPLRQTGWTEYYIGFEGEVADDLMGRGFLTPERQVIEVGVHEELVTLFARALEVATADRASAQQYLAGIALHIIGMVLSISKNKAFEMSDMYRKMEQAKIIMRENVAGEIDPEELAARLNISYSWFRRVFKEYTGYAPAEYFRELKLSRAKEMLVATSLTAKEIAFGLGFGTPEYFFTFFKKRTGLTPAEYRSRGRNK